MHLFYRFLLFLTLSVSLQIAVLTEELHENCHKCINDGKRWAVYKHHDFHVRGCAYPTEHKFFKRVGITLRETCAGLDGDELFAFEPEFPATWPKTCNECINNPDRLGLQWWITKTRSGWIRACLPEKYAAELSKDPKTAKTYPNCEKVRAKNQNQKLLKFRPQELETCAKCVENSKFPWCVIKAHETSFCTKRGRRKVMCPGGKSSTNCTTFPDAARINHVKGLAETCGECLDPENNLDSIWCVASFSGRKIKSCILEVQSDVLCPGTTYDNCSEISSSDKIASVYNPKDTEDEDEDDDMLLSDDELLTKDKIPPSDKVLSSTMPPNGEMPTTDEILTTYDEETTTDDEEPTIDDEEPTGGEKLKIDKKLKIYKKPASDKSSTTDETSRDKGDGLEIKVASVGTTDLSDMVGLSIFASVTGLGAHLIL